MDSTGVRGNAASLLQSVLLLVLLTLTLTLTLSLSLSLSSSLGHSFCGLVSGTAFRWSRCRLMACMQKTASVWDGPMWSCQRG